MTPPTPAQAGHAAGTEPGWSPDGRTLELLGELAGLAWFRVDAERNVVAVSPAMLTLTGFSSAEVLGRPCIHLSRCEECLKGCGLWSEGRIQDHALTLYRRDGEPVEVVKSGRVLRDADGRISGAIELLHTARADDTATPPCGPGSESAAAGATEAERITRALEATRYNRTEAARRLGVSRTTLWRRMRELGLHSVE